MGLNLGQQLSHIPLPFTLDRGVKANGRAVCTGLNDLIQTVKGPAADEENVGGVDLDHLLLRMLPPALGGNIGHRALHNLQKGLLHTFARHIPGDGSIFTLPGNFIHLIDINDTPFGQIDVKIAACSRRRRMFSTSSPT